MRERVKPEWGRRILVLIALGCAAWISSGAAMGKGGEVATPGPTPNLASVDGGSEAAIDAPWRLEPDPQSARRYPVIPIVVSIHDAKPELQTDPETALPLGQFCEMAIREEADFGPSAPTEFRLGNALHEIERSDGWPPNSDVAGHQRRCRPASGQPCSADLEVGTSGEWNATVLYALRKQTAGSDVHLTVQVRVARAGIGCGDPKPIVLFGAPFDRLRPHPIDPNSFIITNRLSVHLGEEPLPRFDQGWAYGDLHYHSQGTDNEGESAYAYRPTLQAMRAMGLDFLFATEHASDSVQTTDIDVVYLRDLVPSWVPGEAYLESLIPSIPIGIETNAKTARDMSPQRFATLLGQLNNADGGNAQVMHFPGRRQAPRIFLGGEVDVIPEMSASERASGSIAYGNRKAYNWKNACTSAGFRYLPLLQQHTTSALCDTTTKLAEPASEWGRYLLKDLQGLSDSYFARQHLVHLPKDGTRHDAFVSSDTELFGGATRRLGPATAGPGEENILRSVLYRDYAVEDKGYVFLAHPVDFASGNGIGRLGPDIVPYSEVQLKTAFQSPSVLGLQLWNEDSRLLSSPAITPGLPGFPLQELDGAPATLSRWLWRKWLGPAPDSAYRDLHDGLSAWDTMLLWGIRRSQTASLPWLPAGQPRRVFMAGGSDAHGDWNYRREGRMSGVAAIVDTAIGKPRNLVHVGLERPETVADNTGNLYGTVGQQQVTSALATGDFAVTDGPALRIAVDENENGVIDDGDVPMGGVSPIGHRGEYVPVLVEWKSTDEFGPIHSIDLYVGVSSDSLDSGLVYAPANHGVHSASTPAGTVDPHPYLDSAGGQHWALLDGYMLDPLGTLRVIPSAAEGKQGRRLVAIRANDYPVGWLRYTPADPGGCEPNYPWCNRLPDDPRCEWECRPPRPASWRFANPSLPDRMFVRAFARTVRQAGALCEPPGLQTEAGTIAQWSGRCNERLAFTNPVWVDNTSGPPPGDFDMTCTPSILNLHDGNTSTCTVSSTGGFARPVHLGCARLTAAASCLFEPATVIPAAGGTVTTTLTLSVGPIPAGTYEFQAQATRPGVTRSSLMTFIAGSVPGGDLTAAFDATRQAPSCGTMIGRSCDSVWLVTGRGLGPRVNAEAHPPSTIARSCNEAGSSGRFPPERYINRVKVSTTDGTPLERGKLVSIDADVAMLSEELWSHAVDFFYAADAAQPVWTLIGSVQPYQPELHTVSATYLLPAGDLQAVRVQIRAGASSVPCAADTRADRDDLIFAVK